MVEQFPLSPDGGHWAGRRLSQVLKALRRRRNLRPAEVAAAMGMPLRSYEHFEAGRGRLNLERVSAFAAATDSDPFAILASLAFGAPDFAVRCADNKLMLVMMVELEELNATAGDDLARLPPRSLFAAFRKTFGELAAQAQAPVTFLDALREMRTSDGDASPEEAPA